MFKLLEVFAKNLPLCACLAACPAIIPDSVDLNLERTVFLECPGVLNLSGIALDSSGAVYFADDRGPVSPDWIETNPVLVVAPLDSILRSPGGKVTLSPAGPAGGFDYSGLAKKTGKESKFDIEGIAPDGPGRLWAVDERDRLLLEFDLKSGAIRQAAGAETLLGGQEDLLAAGLNTSFEGVARIGDCIFIAQEMRPSMILVYRISKGFRLERRVTVPDCPDLNDLCAENGFLYALGRTKSEIYKIGPESGVILAVASFKACADSIQHRYVTQREEYYNSEGLGLTGRYVLVVLDGNGQPLRQSDERRPLLFIFRRPAGF